MAGGDDLETPILPRLSSDYGDGDVPEITSCGQFVTRKIEENKKLVVLGAIAQNSLGAATQFYAGHLTTLELDAVSIEKLVIAGLAFGIMGIWGWNDLLHSSANADIDWHHTLIGKMRRWQQNQEMGRVNG